ncbi:MAG TPA: GtrA family protein [Lacibacter sp.]|nr:GtrA family protein [Lacibacter sp.]HMO89610.1 GtrA family protein [Lacibacter sp.]
MVQKTVAFLHGCIGWFYPPFRRIMPEQTFRYAACGGGNTLLDITLFVIGHEYIFRGELVELPFVTLTPHIAAFLLAFSITFPVGFFLSRYVVFEERSARKREQLPKYMMVVAGAILLNYFFLKVFIETMGLHAAMAKILTTAVVVAFSYYSQKHFTFRAKVG